MKKAIIIAVILSLSTLAFASKRSTKHSKNVYKNTNVFSKVDFNKLFKVLCKKESNNNPRAIGDGGKAHGIIQIWKSVIADVNQYGKEKFSSSDRFSVEKSKKICRLYLERYGKEYYRKTGRIPTYETFFRMWNGGGPAGYRYSSTIGYKNDCLKILKNL